MGDSESSDEEERVFVRRPRIFRERISYFYIEDTYEFNERFRLPSAKFYVILNRIEQQLAHDTRRNYALTPKQQLMVALHWLGSGMQYHSAGDMHGISKATVCRIVHKVVLSINRTMLRETVCWPDDIGRVMYQFKQIAGMPLVCGAVDGTLIKVDAPSLHEPAFVDRHGNHSLNIMLVCGPSLKFYYVSANWPGSDLYCWETPFIHLNHGLFHLFYEMTVTLRKCDF
ncbi:putative nuclease HARBI1 [Anthonomus grandis grandis]|uniref:putative nuclease HARBI1 n=1 Tax=Anthonomus grandis grandis TaxID=2921223 RepID=UPI002164FEBB|nr:putative nuclease HARBI1 [Anthonomus grandis grandis]XP_050313688.1 putative nuclease HARBI1 [Anthonomus grandis grandis]XP_050316187.1 putative nuclease HARBI1 [Anthonomus grandis grandis]